jgi:threonine/homoserine/homoserine lactone efflux protein
MPLIFFIFLGAGSLLQLSWVRILIGLAGGIYLIFMGKGLLGEKEYGGNPVQASVTGGETRDISNREGFAALKKGYVPASFYSGIFLSIGNPSFLLWWLNRHRTHNMPVGPIRLHCCTGCVTCSGTVVQGR